MDTRPIGVFDSGLGGLTVVKELHRILPHEDIIYLGDNARAPYGSLSQKTIVEYAKQDVAFLLQNNVKAIIVACGTVSANALDSVKNLTNLPVLGVIQPTANFLARKKNIKKILVLGTSAAIRAHAYSDALLSLDQTLYIVEQACPAFVVFIENNFLRKRKKIIGLFIKKYLRKHKNIQFDYVIMGCTHYPLLEKNLLQYNKNYNLINVGQIVADAFNNEIINHIDENDQENNGKINLYFTKKFYNSKIEDYFPNETFASINFINHFKK